MAETASPVQTTTGAAAPSTIAPSQSETTNNNTTTIKPPSNYSKSTDGKGRRSGEKSTERRRRRKRHAKIPETFAEWKEEEKNAFQEVNKMMKNWKATQRQCVPVIANLGRFKSIKQKMKPDDQYKRELKEYEESIKSIPKIGPDESFDYEDRMIDKSKKN